MEHLYLVVASNAPSAGRRERGLTAERTFGWKESPYR